MTFNNFFQAVWEKFYHGNKPAPMPREVRILFHWKIMVVAFLLLAIMAFISSFLIYRDISRGEFLPAEKKASGNSATATAALLDKTAGFFKTKSAAFNQLRKNPPSVDPSR